MPMAVANSGETLKLSLSGRVRNTSIRHPRETADSSRDVPELISGIRLGMQDARGRES
jgi:hypothetical protein